jgi:hypothetical protein
MVNSGSRSSGKTVAGLRDVTCRSSAEGRKGARPSVADTGRHRWGWLVYGGRA